MTNAITGATTGVSSFNTRTGAVTLQAADVIAAGGAPIVSPTFTGNPAAPTPTAGDSSTKLATTAFVGTAIGSLPPGVATFNGRTGVVALQLTDVTSVGGAPLAAPTFTGVAQSVTPPPADNSQRIATTAFVAAAVPLASTTTPLMDGAAAIGSGVTWAKADHVHPTDTTRAAASALGNYLPLTGGTLTGPLAGTTISTTANVYVGTQLVLQDGGNGFLMQNKAQAKTRWWVGQTGTESGSDSGSQFFVTAMHDDGSYGAQKLSISRDASGMYVTDAIKGGFGYYGKAGTGGGYTNIWNFNWAGGNVGVWIDNVFNVNIAAMQCGLYRIKKDVTPLGSTWATVKALKPISYTQAEYHPHVAPVTRNAETGEATPMFPADDIERWGFIAHELQETLIPSAASGVKDQPDAVQAPNPLVIIAALTKALQEAMTRIEALEERIAA